MDSETYRYALDLIELGSPTKGKSALDAAIEAAKQEERKRIAASANRREVPGGVSPEWALSDRMCQALKCGERPEE